MGNNSSIFSFSARFGWFGTVTLFLVVCLVGDRGLAQLAQTAVVASELRFSRVYRGGLATAVLILGDSRAVNCCYAPALTGLLGVPVFNLGYNGASPLIQEALVNDYLDHNEAPELVVLEVTNVGDEHQFLRALQSYRGKSDRLDQLLKLREPRLHTAGSFAHLFRFNNELTLRSLYYLRREDQSWINRYQINSGQIEMTRAMSNVTLQAHPENLAALARTVQLLRRRKIAVKLLVSPYFPLYLSKLENFEVWRDDIARVTGSAVEDYSDALSARAYFADRIHLNAAGGEALARRLVADGFFAAAVAQ